MWALTFYSCFLSFHLILAQNEVKYIELEDLNSDEATDGATASSTQIITTSITPTTEVPSIPCPPEKSLHTRDDIKTMINYRVNTLLIYDHINKSYYPQAVAVRVKHVNDINQFRAWYQTRPEHLKHILEGFGYLRDQMEPVVKNVAEAIKLYPELQEKYDIEFNRTQGLLNKLNRYKKICENNCETKQSLTMTRRSNYNGYYCSSLEELDHRIKTELKEFANIIISATVNKLNDDDKLYTTKIDELKNKLKDVALKDFGRTMYDVLTLQDEYHHFIEDIKQIDANSEVYNIKEINLLIETKLLELEQRIEKYGTYCRTCNMMSQLSMPMKTVSSSIDLVDYLLKLKFNEIENAVSKEYTSIFDELNILLDTIDSNNTYITVLKPIQDEIIELLKTQRKNFNELKSNADRTSFTKLIKLSSDSKQLLENINNAIDFLHKFGNSEFVQPKLVKKVVR